MAELWNIGNTTLRNPERIPGALRIFNHYYDNQASFSGNQKQQGEFFDKILTHTSDGLPIDGSDPTLVPIYEFENGGSLAMPTADYKQKNGRMWLSTMDELGFTNAYDNQSLATLPGKISIKYPELSNDIWFRQLLKFQYPNHKKKIDDVCIRPAVVLLKLILKFNGLTKFELGLVNLLKNENLTNISNKITEYRAQYQITKKQHKIKKLQHKIATEQIIDYFSTDFNTRVKLLNQIINEIQTPHSNITEILNKLYIVFRLGKGSNTQRAKSAKTEIIAHLKKLNYNKNTHQEILANYYGLVKSGTIWKDYVDLNVRYLMMCGMIHWYKKDETTERRLVIDDRFQDFVKDSLDSLKDKISIETEKDKQLYKKYLLDINEPHLAIDDPEILDKKIFHIEKEFTKIGFNSIPEEKCTEISPKRLLYNRLIQKLYDTKEVVFANNLDKTEIEKQLILLVTNPKKITPTQLESLIWKAILSLKGYKMHPSQTRNFHVDSNFESIFTAAGDMPDIQFDYENFDLIVEVTKTEGITQWRAEQEPVPRHVATHKFFNKRESYCIFIAPTINNETRDRFFKNSKNTLTEVIKGQDVYVKIIPINFSQFLKIYQTCKLEQDPTSKWLEVISNLQNLVDVVPDSNEWMKKINHYISSL